MYEGFNPVLLKEARRAAAINNSDVLTALQSLVREWKAVNRPTLIGDFRLYYARRNHEVANRVSTV